MLAAAISEARMVDRVSSEREAMQRERGSVRLQLRATPHATDRKLA
jgi:hypothetical protein